MTDKRTNGKGTSGSPSSRHDHRGAFVWANASELVWECAEDCPHPSHERL